MDLRGIKILELIIFQFYIISNLTDPSDFYFVVTDIIVK